MNFLKKAVDTLLVDALRGFQYVEVHSHLGRQVNESLHILGETETAVAKPGLEELAADARVQSHSVGNFLDVGADFFAEISDHIGIADFQSEKRIGGVLDEFGAVDGGDEEFRFVARRAGTVVHWAAKAFLENRTVDFAEFRGGRGILDADNDAVRMEKVSDGGAFTKKFRIGGHAELHGAIFGVRGQGAAEFESRARGYGALLDHQFGRFRFGGDLPRHAVDS